MGSFLKGLTVGLVSFVAGFTALSVLFPPDEVTRAPMVPVADVAEPDVAPAAMTPGEDTTSAEDMAPDGMEDGPAGSAGVEDGVAGSDVTGSGVRGGDAVEEPVAGGAAPGDGGIGAGGMSASEVAPEEEPNDQAVSGQPGAETVEPDPAPAVEPESAPATAGQGDVSGQGAETAEPAPEPDAAPVADPAPETPAPQPDGAAPDAPDDGESLPVAPQAGEENGAEGAAGPATVEPEAPAVPAPQPAPGGGLAVDGGADEPAAPDAAPEAPAAPTPVMRAVPPAPPSPGLERAVEGVVVGRLPTIADAEPAAAESAGASASDSDETAPATQPAWQRFASAHDNPAGLPLFAVIVLDTQRDQATEAALVGMPFTLSVALDPADADAPRRADVYRSVGHEVLILGAGVPALATPSDLEVTFDGWARALPEAVAMLDPPDGGLQGNRELAQNLMPFLAGRGLGLVTLERGLNPAQQSARRAGVVSTGAFRVIDDEEENAATIRRYLDRATFRAQQEGQVAVIGHASHAPTLEALLVWRMEGRAGQVSLAPVSALLDE